MDNKQTTDANNNVDSIIEELLSTSVKKENPATESKPQPVPEKPAFELELEQVLAGARLEDEKEIPPLSSPLEPEALAQEQEYDPFTGDVTFEDTIEDGEESAEYEGLFENTPNLQLPQEIGFTNKRPIWPPIICALVVFILLTGGICYYNRTTELERAAEQALIQQRGDSLLDESIALIQEADSVIVALDKATEAQTTKEDIPKLEALLEQLESVHLSLDAAIEKAEEAQGVYVEAGRTELAQHAEDAARYRKQMLDLNSKLAAYDLTAIKTALVLDEAWALIVDADIDMRNAVEVVIEEGADGVEDSRDYNQSAVYKLAEAGDKLAEATVLFSGLDVSVLSDYLVAKKASAELALASDQAFLDGLYWEADSLNYDFIEKDAEAVELAAHIPASPLSLVVSLYDEVTKDLRTDYSVVRSQAADADAFLRAYLGVSILDDGTGSQTTQQKQEQQEGTTEGELLAEG